MGHVVQIVASNELPIKACISKCQQIPLFTYLTQSEVEARADTRFIIKYTENGMYNRTYGLWYQSTIHENTFHVEAGIGLNP